MRDILGFHRGTLLRGTALGVEPTKGADQRLGAAGLSRR